MLSNDLKNMLGDLNNIKTTSLDK